MATLNFNDPGRIRNSLRSADSKNTHKVIFYLWCYNKWIHYNNITETHGYNWKQQT